MTRRSRPAPSARRTAAPRPRAAGPAALCLGLALGLGACASPADEPGGASPEPTVTVTEGETVSPKPEGTTSGRPEQMATEMGVTPGEAGRGLPEGMPGADNAPLGAAWTAEPGLLYVITYGSSSCPVLAEAQAESAESGVQVTLIPPPADGICTMDWAPTTTVVAVPEGTDETAPLSVALGDQATVEVAPRAAEGEAGEPAWAVTE